MLADVREAIVTNFLAAQNERRRHVARVIGQAVGAQTVVERDRSMVRKNASRLRRADRRK